MLGRVATLCVVVLSGMATAQEFTTLKGHGGPVMALDTGPDDRLVSASFDNSAAIWTGRTPEWLEGHDAAVTAILADGAGRLFTGSDDFTVRQWLPKRRVIGTHQGKVTTLATSPDGSTLASGSWDGSVWLWSLNGEAPAQLASPGAGVNTLVYSADGARIYAGTTAGKVLVYNLNNTEAQPRVLARHGFGVNRLAVGPGWIVYGAVDGGTRVIDAETGAQIADFTLDRWPILALDYNPATSQIAVGDGVGYIMVIDARTWRIVRDFRAMREGPVWALSYSLDGAQIYAAGNDDVVYAWPVAFLDRFDPAQTSQRSYLRKASSMPNGERQFMRKCSICHALDAGSSRKAGPTLYGVFGRRAGTLAGYRYSDRLAGSPIVWSEETIDALFGQGPDHYIPGSKMPMQVIAAPEDRADLIEFLKRATSRE